MSPFNRSNYPADWEAIRDRVRRRSGDACEFCGAKNGFPHPHTGSRVVLTVAHLDHGTRNNRMSNLRHLCQRCHLRHDLQQHMANAAATRMERRIHAG
ncbi:hypothetical protein JW777_00735 [bacterium]|nr:hypothetical protein [bacterium]